MPDAIAQVKKKRNTGTLAVECQTAESDWHPCSGQPLADMKAAERWIEEDGETGITYRIVRDMGTYAVTTTTRLVKK